jgi:hypothetical protein
MKRLVAFGLTFGVAALTFVACGDDSTDPPSPVEGVRVIFDLTVDLASQDHFFDAPYPLDTRLSPDGHPQLAGFPNPTGSVIVGGLVSNAAESRGFPVIPVVFFRFDGPVAPQDGLTTLPGEPSSSIHLIDVDESSPDYGKLIPIVAKTLEVDPRYTPENVLAVAPRPGFILRPNTRYGVAVMDSLGDVEGELLATSPLLERIKIGKTEGAAEETLTETMAPLWPALEAAGVDPPRVVAATVFTTGDVVAELAAIGDQVLADHDVTIEGLALDPTEDYPELCVLRGTISMPQFQKGTQPFDTEGRFEFADGKLVQQGTLDVPAAVVIPKRTMPVGGYPLILNVHGSGGYSIAMVRPVGDDGTPGAPIGPAFPHAAKNIATAGIAMPVNPERLPGASEIEYLNVDNFGAMRDTFRQGTIEARLFLEALTRLEIPPATLSACAGAALPAGETAFRFDPDRLVVMGQSMGGMYTNFLAATEPALKAAVPTGAGGHWTYFIMLTPLEGGAYPGQLQIVLQSGPLSFFHPLFAIGAAGLEAADPMVYMPRVARRPLDGHPVRPVYEPVAIGDSYFPTEIYDAAALAYGHRQAGEEVWPTMQATLALVGLEGVSPFPITQNVTSETGEDYTGVVAQFEGDGTYDPHAIYSHRDDVKRQYSCFLDSFFATGIATVPPLSDDWAAPCP